MTAAANPYAPPRAHVTDFEGEGDGGTQPLSVTGYKGRIGRLRYLAWMCGAYLLLAVLGAIGGGLVAVTGAPEILNVVIGIASVGFLVFWVFWTIQRSHDMGWSGWTWLFTLIPLVVLVWVFNGGTRGRNRFGAPPPPNTLGVHLLAWLLPFIFFIGLLAAIALPAYQAYHLRAKAMQAQPVPTQKP